MLKSLACDISNKRSLVIVLILPLLQLYRFFIHRFTFAIAARVQKNFCLTVKLLNMCTIVCSLFYMLSSCVLLKTRALGAECYATSTEEDVYRIIRNNETTGENLPPYQFDIQCYGERFQTDTVVQLTEIKAVDLRRK